SPKPKRAPIQSQVRRVSKVLRNPTREGFTKKPRSGKKNMRCKYCNQTFFNRDEQKYHIVHAHPLVKQFRCVWQDCAFFSMHRFNTETHIRTIHFNLPETLKEQKRLNIKDDRNPREYMKLVDGTDLIPLYVE